jgi:hypothetical protein
MSISLLPDDLLLSIFRLVGKENSLIVGLVSKRWHWIAMRLWKGRLSLAHPGYAIPPLLYANVTMTSRLPYELYSSGTDTEFLDYIVEAGHDNRLFKYYRSSTNSCKAGVRCILSRILAEVPTPDRPTLRTVLTRRYWSDESWNVVVELYPKSTNLLVIPDYPAIWWTTVTWTM